LRIKYIIVYIVDKKPFVNKQQLQNHFLSIRKDSYI